MSHPRTKHPSAVRQTRGESLVAAAFDGTRNWFGTLESGWQDFWFSPTDPTVLGLLRILTGLMLLYTHAVWGLELEAFFGATGWQSSELIRALQSEQFAFSFWWWIPPESIHVAHIASLLVLAMFTVGLLSPVTSVLACVISISYAHRAPVALFGLDQINTMLALYLAIGGCGQALSLDRLLTRFRQIRRSVGAGSGRIDLSPAASSRANLGIRLIQVHMCVIYFFAGVSKLQGTAWWNGEAMWLAFANLEYQSADMTWLARFPLMINVITHTTVIWEISFCALVWVRPLRPAILLMAVVLHVGIGAVLGMWTFGLVMLIGCGAFVRPSALQSIGLIFRPAGEFESRIVRYDGDCIGCRREAVLVKFFDLFDRVELVEASDHTSTHDGSEPSEPQRRWTRVASWQHRHRDRVPTSREEREADQEATADNNGQATAEPQTPRGDPVVLCIGQNFPQHRALCSYLSKRGYDVLKASDLDEGLTQAEVDSPDCVVLAGKRLEVDQFAGFQNLISEIDDEAMTSVVVLAPKQRHFLSQLRVNRAERVLVQPISLRELRTEIESALDRGSESNETIELDQHS